MKIDYPLNFIKADSISEVGAILNNLDLSSNNYVIISGPTKSLSITASLMEVLKHKPVKTYKVDINFHKNIDRTFHEVLKLDVNCIISIGGGVVTDFAKRLAYLSKLKLISIPTTVSNDGMASPIAVLSENKRKTSLIGKMPDTIIVPLEILKQAPLKFIKAALLDTLSNVSAVNDWHYADKQVYLNNSNSMAISLSKMAASMVLNIKNLSLKDNRILNCALDVQLLSGMSMTIAGSSRPCSGSEHIISHALDELNIAENILHGEKVGTIAEFTLFLQGKEDESVSRLLRNFGINKGIPGFNKLNKNQMLKVFTLSKKLRPERKNILYKYSVNQLYNYYIEFLGL